jgi:CheY-like chemotaxis protein
MRYLLDNLGCTVTVAGNGREAVTKFVEHEFDVVLMDVQMPVMDGIAATQIIRQHEYASGNHTPIIAVTAGVDRESCMEAGMDDHLIKPVCTQSLQRVLNQVADLRLDSRCHR